jgi:predicted alpha/beta hydrolase family esterase
MLTVLIVPGLRDHVAEHWQTLLAPRLPALGFDVRSVPPMGRDNLDCAARIEALQREAAAITGPYLIVAHSGGCVTVARWAMMRRAMNGALFGALLAVPPDFERPMPKGYPAIDAMRAAGWLPMPRARLPFRSIVAASRNDPLATYERVAGFARDWGSELVDLGDVGHLNPASGFGPWTQAEILIRQLAVTTTAPCLAERFA